MEFRVVELSFSPERAPRAGSRVRRAVEPRYRVDDSKLSRYDQRNLIFNRIFSDQSWPGFMRTEEERGLQNIAEARPGYDRVDYALAEASWTVHDVWTDAFSPRRLLRPGGPSLMGDRWHRDRYEVRNVADMTRKLKRAAKLYGASLVGIAELDRRWLYLNRRFDLEPIELPEDLRYAVVMAIAMDEVGIALSPACPAAAATGVGYSMMAFTASCLAEFIRNLGYSALPAGNDVALSIPIAIDAGLGQLGRNGLLITPQFGPRVRLCKVFTDLPLEPDEPIDFGVTEFCRRCRRCAEACEVEAISKETEPSWTPACRSNNPGALKWYVNSERCYQFWCENGTDCSTCIAVCPYSKVPSRVSLEEFWG